MKEFKHLFLSLPLFALLATPSFAQEAAGEDYVFTTVKEAKITSVKNQASSSTCWSFSGLGFFEAEAIRNGGLNVDLAPMYVVSQSYKDKARDYMRYQGNLNFAPGGSFGDVLTVLRGHGVVPMSEMEGLNYGTKRHQHGELDAVTKGYMDTMLKQSGRTGTVTSAWTKGFDAIVDAYLGESPKDFTYNGKKYTPQSFLQALKLNLNDYVSLTSYTHHPFYSQFVLEIPDNWRHGLSYNLPIDELMQVIENATDNGYAIAWGADVSEVGFTRNGLGLLVDMETAPSGGSDQERWVGASPTQRRSLVQERLGKINMPEIKVTQEYRQECFDNGTLTDDHGMVIYGVAKDQTGKKFYLVKNSWGEAGQYKGIWYVSEPYVAGRTMNILINKNAIPKAIRAKLGI